MSHFTVLVVGENPEEQLAPYQENNMGDCPKQYLSFFDLENEYRKEFDYEGTEVVIKPDGSRHSKYSSEFYVEVESDGPFKKTEFRLPSGCKLEFIAHKERYDTFEQFVKEHHGDSERDPEKGRYGYWENPNKKWDWYSLGGRWTGFFKLKKGTGGVQGDPGIMTDPAQKGWVDQCRKGDIDLAGMLAERQEAAARTWDKDIAPKLKNKSEANYLLFAYGVSPDSTKEDYVRSCGSFSTFAVLKDGIWYEKGSMGWWGVVSDKKEESQWEAEFDRLVSSLPDDTLLSVYDCHI